MSDERAFGQRVIDGIFVPNGYEQLTSLSTAQSLTPPAHSIICMIQAEGQSVRWRDDGIDPTSSVGMILQEGDNLFYNGQARLLRFIEAVKGAKLNVTYYR